MDKTGKYFVYGVPGEEKTEALLDKAKATGFDFTLKNMRENSVALLNLSGFGITRFPAVFKDGKPDEVFMGDHDYVMDFLTRSETAPVSQKAVLVREAEPENEDTDGTENVGNTKAGDKFMENDVNRPANAKGGTVRSISNEPLQGPNSDSPAMACKVPVKEDEKPADKVTKDADKS